MANFLCWYAKHWFLSYMLLTVIMLLAVYTTQTEGNNVPPRAVLLFHIIAVIGIRYLYGDKCLEEDKAYYIRQANIAAAKLS